MNDEAEALRLLESLETLEPPRGGLAKLRRRLDRRVRRERIARHSLAFGGVAAALVVFAVFAVTGPIFERPVGSPLPIGDELIAMQFGFVAAPTEPVSIGAAHRETTAVLRIPTDDERVVLYLVGTRTGE